MKKKPRIGSNTAATTGTAIAAGLTDLHQG